jgi:hypothetical protein
MSRFDSSWQNMAQSDATIPEQPQLEITPPVGVTPPPILAQEAASGRRGAAWRLLQLVMENDPRAVEAISSLDDDRLARNLLEYIALGTWDGKPFVAPPPLRSPYTRTRLRTLFVPPSGIDPSRGERVLHAALHDRRPAVRETAMHTLGLMGSRSAVPELIQALHDPVPSTREQAAKALGRSGSPEAVPTLLDALHNADEPQSNQIFKALVNLGHLAVPALLDASQSNSSWMRWQSVRALGEIHDSRALPVLVRALNDSDHGVAWMAAKSVAPFGRDCIAPVLHLLTTTAITPWLRETSAYVLSRQCQNHSELKPYLDPLLQQLHQSFYREGAGYAALKAQEQLEASRLLKQR